MKDFRFQIPVRRFITAVLFAVLFVGPSLIAQTQPPPAAMDGFVPMNELAAREVLPATPLVFFAYAFVWLALIGYVFWMWRRMSRVEQDLADVQRRLKDR